MENLITEQLENFTNAHSRNLADAKAALSQKNWKEFCQSMKPLFMQAEEYGLIHKGTATKTYNESSKDHINPSHFAAESAKVLSEHAQKMGKKCNEETKAFFQDLKELSVHALKITKDLIHKATHAAHEQGKR